MTNSTEVTTEVDTKLVTWATVDPGPQPPKYVCTDIRNVEKGPGIWLHTWCSRNTKAAREAGKLVGLLPTPHEEPAKSQDIITSAVLQNPLVTKIRMHSAQQSETAPSCPSGTCAVATRLCLIQKHQEMLGKKKRPIPCSPLYTKGSKEAELCPRLGKESTD